MLYYLQGLWQIPLALFSFLFYRLIRLPVVRMGLAAVRRQPENFYVWRVMSGERMKDSTALLRTVITAPRWNTHVVVATSGPWWVEESIEIELDAPRASGEHFYVGAYDFPGFEDRHHGNTLTLPDEERFVFRVPEPGYYFLALRYYHPEPKMTFPEIQIDGAARVAAVQAEGDINAFYNELHTRATTFHRALHYYIYPMVKFGALLPEPFIKHELLPVGSRDTVFFYGAVERGTVLAFDIDPELMKGYTLYLTVYNCASFPILWFEVDRADYRSAPCPANGVYLMRHVRTGSEGRQQTAVLEPKKDRSAGMLTMTLRPEQVAEAGGRVRVVEEP